MSYQSVILRYLDPGEALGEARSARGLRETSESRLERVLVAAVDPAVIENDVTLGCLYRAAALHRDF